MSFTLTERFRFQTCRPRVLDAVLFGATLGSLPAVESSVNPNLAVLSERANERAVFWAGRFLGQMRKTFLLLLRCLYGTVPFDP